MRDAHFLGANLRRLSTSSEGMPTNFSGRLKNWCFGPPTHRQHHVNSAIGVPTAMGEKLGPVLDVIKQFREENFEDGR